MLRVTTRFTGPQGAPWINMLHFSGDDTQAGADAAVVRVGAFWGAVDALMGASVSWATDAEVEQINVLTGDQEAVFVTTPQTGAGTTGDPVPFAAQGVVRLRTGNYNAGVEVRGRIFIPVLLETQATQGKLVSTAQSTIQTAATALRTGSPTLVVYSRAHIEVPAVTSTSVWDSFAVLRSRRD